MVGENGPLLDGWAAQPGRHCGELCVDMICPVCRMPADPTPVTTCIDDWPYSLMSTLGEN